MRHYSWAGGFLLLAAMVIGQGAAQGVRGSLHRSAHRHSAGAAVDKAALRSEVAAAIAVGKSGDFQEAVRSFERLSSKYPQQAAVWLNLGIALGAEGRVADAAAAFQQVLSIVPNDHDALAELANLALQRGDLTLAVDLAKDIPVGEGQLKKRLASDARWLRVQHEPRVVELRRRHGLPVSDTSERARRELEKANRRRN